MFGRNEIVGKKYFNDASGRLMVTSMFMTLQGEGPFSGCPAFFVRLSKCQLACSFCDTFFDDGKWFELDELEAAIDAKIKEYYGQRPAWADKIVLVITGGEPMLQSNLVAFLASASNKWARIQIESNGLVLQELPPNVILVVSPKCREKNGVAVEYLNPNAKVLARADCLKFVMSADPDSPYWSVPDWAHEWHAQTGLAVYLSPMNEYLRMPAASQKLRQEQRESTLDERSSIDEVISFWEEGLLDREKNQRNHEHAAQYAIRHGLRLSLQQHLYASLP